MKRIAAAFVVAGALIGFGAVAHAQDGDYPPQAPTVTVSDATPTAGAQFTVTVTCEGTDEVTFTFQGESQTDTCADGTATASFAAPTAPGTYTVTATLATGATVTTNVTVAATPSEAELPATGGGGSAETTLWIAGGLLLAGAAMFLVAQQRRRQAGIAAS